MKENRFPPGWNEERVKRLLAQSESISEEQQTAEDETAVEAHSGQAIISVPEELLPAIRHLLANPPAL